MLAKTLEEGDVIIRRCSNGWALSLVDATDCQGHVEERVYLYEDRSDDEDNEEVAYSNSLVNCLNTAFADYTANASISGIAFSVTNNQDQ